MDTRVFPTNPPNSLTNSHIMQPGMGPITADCNLISVIKSAAYVIAHIFQLFRQTSDIPDL